MSAPGAEGGEKHQQWLQTSVELLLVIAVDRKACSVIILFLLLFIDFFAPILAHDFEHQYVVEAGDNVNEEE